MAHSAAARIRWSDPAEGSGVVAYDFAIAAMPGIVWELIFVSDGETLDRNEATFLAIADSFRLKY